MHMSTPVTGTKAAERHRRAHRRRALTVFALPIIVGGFLLLSWGQVAHAATLSLAPTTGTYQVGKTFAVRISAASLDQAMNAASGTLTFPPKVLEVVSVSKSSSIISLWVQEPSFSNDAGRVNFEGIVLNSGYTGSGGLLLTVTFRAKAAGDAAVNFTGASVLANDGQGTNILSGLGSARFTIGVPVTTPPAPEATTPTGVPFAPKVSSSTNPDPNRWYASDDVSFRWAVPAGTTGVNVLADRDPTTNPGTRSDGIFDTYTYEDVEEGAWYFHLRLQNAQGWGAISHFQFQIDTESPESPVIQLVDGKETNTPRPRIAVNVRDRTSGIEYITVKIGEGAAVRVVPEAISEQSPYAIEPQAPGRHTIVVQAFDRAGNATTDTEEFTVIPLPSPEITEYPAELPEGEVLKIRGRSTPNARVRIALTPEAGKELQQEVETAGAGEFAVIWPERLRAGLYSFTAQVTDARGAQSDPTPARTIAVHQRAVLRIGSLVVTYLSVSITLLALVLLLALVVVYGWYRFLLLRRQLRREVREAERILHKAFDRLREDVRKQIKLLERVRTRRELTEEEETIIQRLKKDLDEAEQLVQKEIEDIEKKA